MPTAQAACTRTQLHKQHGILEWPGIQAPSGQRWHGRLLSDTGTSCEFTWCPTA